MTTFFRKQANCAHCGAIVEWQAVASTNAFGSMDLDMRPPPMERDTLQHDMQQCDACGFCSPAIDSGEGVDMTQVGLPQYANLACDDRFPLVARRFLAYAHMARAKGCHTRTAWASLRAAWVCDDSGSQFRGSATTCRFAALEAIDRLHAEGKTFSPDMETDQTLRLDMLRRAGEFQSTIELAARLRAAGLPEILAKLAAFQAKQAASRSQECYTIDQAMA